MDARRAGAADARINSGCRSLYLFWPHLCDVKRFHLTAKCSSTRDSPGKDASEGRRDDQTSIGPSTPASHDDRHDDQAPCVERIRQEEPIGRESRWLCSETGPSSTAPGA